ncbi:MAG: amidohydrolase family protein [Oscillospiraceae bacterium]|nr:amidohydrolase family protein [Oscillospiraceae bacterium]MBQ3225023.1 amidohydrolase family protein [Oscillospiraceae bacterium]
MGRILIKNGKIWNGEHFSSADILTDGDNISKIERNIVENADYVFDASGKIVSAGLVDGHVHMRGVNEKFGIHAEMSSIPFGVTAAVDACGAYGDKALLDSFLLKNLIFVPVEFRNNKACFEAAEKMLEKYGEKAVGIKAYFDTQVSDVKDIKPLCEAIEYAKKNKLIVMVHSSNSPVSMPELLGALRKGDILTHAYHGGKNNVSKDNYACIKEAKRRGVIIDAGLAGHIHTDFRVFKTAIECDALPDIISTDITKFSAYKRGGRYGMTMCMSIAKTLGMRDADIFRCVTSSPAKAFGKENEWGYLKRGRCADISVFEYADEGFDLTDRTGNKLKSDMGYRCVLTISDGEVVYRR